MDATGRGARPAHDLIHPVPQRRYAFIFATDGETGSTSGTSPHTVLNAMHPHVDGLQRPISAPAGMGMGMGMGMGLGSSGVTSDMPLTERPTSPLSRVGNPMVRDYLFRRGVAAAGDVGAQRCGSGNAARSGQSGVPAKVSAAGGGGAGGRATD